MTTPARARVYSKGSTPCTSVIPKGIHYAMTGIEGIVTAAGTPPRAEEIAYPRVCSANAAVACPVRRPKRGRLPRFARNDRSGLQSQRQAKERFLAMLEITFGVRDTQGSDGQAG